MPVRGDPRQAASRAVPRVAALRIGSRLPVRGVGEGRTGVPCGRAPARRVPRWRRVRASDDRRGGRTFGPAGGASGVLRRAAWRCAPAPRRGACAGGAAVAASAETPAPTCRSGTRRSAPRSRSDAVADGGPVFPLLETLQSPARMASAILLPPPSAAMARPIAVSPARVSVPPAPSRQRSRKWSTSASVAVVPQPPQRANSTS